MTDTAENDAPWSCCGHAGYYHGPEVPGCCECRCRCVIPPEQPDWFTRKTHIIPPAEGRDTAENDPGVSMSLSKGHTAENDVLLFACCAHCGCPLSERIGHDDTCRLCQCSCGNRYDGDNLCMASACQSEGIEPPAHARVIPPASDPS